MKAYDIQKPQDIHISDQDPRIEFYIDASEKVDYDAMVKVIYDKAPTSTEPGVEKTSLIGKVVTQEFYNGFINYLNQSENTIKQSIDGNLQWDLDYFYQYIDIYLKSYGEYDNTKSYFCGECFTYNGDLYCTIADVTSPGDLPTDTSSFLRLGLKGLKGYTSLGVKIVGEWNVTTTYDVKDIVYFNKKMYVAKTQNTNSSPDTGVEDWEFIINCANSFVDIGTSTPTYKVKGSIWFDNN